jgi:hypothetical protein
LIKAGSPSEYIVYAGYPQTDPGAFHVKGVIPQDGDPMGF